MKRILTAALAVAVLSWFAFGISAEEDAKHRTLIELFTSQG
jgi:hypothetical protein